MNQPIAPFNDAMRALAHDVVDLLFDHVQNVDARPVVDWTPASELRELVRLEAGQGDYRQLVRLVAEKSIQLHHRSYMGHQVCPPLPEAVIGDLVVSLLNQSTAVWEMSPVGTVIEREIIRWLSALAGYPETSTGTAVSGGSAANLTGLLAARARWRHDGTHSRPVIVCSADAHYSVARAASIMGIAAADVLKVATDAAHRMDVDALETTLAALEADGMAPLAIVATSGSTATGAFDRLDEIAVLRDRYRTWLHVDAAHGASVLLSPALAPLVNGLSRADSLSWDPHKMMWMPLSLGVILVRDATWLRRAFEADAPYLFNADRAAENLGEMTIQCSKRADAIKLWLALKSSGPGPIVRALEHVTLVTRHLYDAVEDAPDFEPLHVPELNIFCFRYVGPPELRIPAEELDARNAAIRERLIQSGEAWITSTILKGARALRVTIINPKTTNEDVERMLEAVRRVAAS
jgi:L-2,4-diaminobutyrate decarboxylase